MSEAVLVAMVLVATAVAFFYGRKYQRQKIELAQAKAAIELQNKVAAVYRRALERDEKTKAFLDRVEKASTADDLNSVYEELSAQLGS